MEQYQNGVSGFERFIEIMDTEPEITENETETSAESINDETFEENIASVNEEIEEIEELAYKIQEENEKDEENDPSGFFMEI
jgi:hypothetical protein